MNKTDVRTREFKKEYMLLIFFLSNIYTELKRNLDPQLLTIDLLAWNWDLEDGDGVVADHVGPAEGLREEQKY